MTTSEATRILKRSNTKAFVFASYSKNNARWFETPKKDVLRLLTMLSDEDVQDWTFDDKSLDLLITNNR